MSAGRQRYGLELLQGWHLLQQAAEDEQLLQHHGGGQGRSSECPVSARHRLVPSHSAELMLLRMYRRRWKSWERQPRAEPSLKSLPAPSWWLLLVPTKG